MGCLGELSIDGTMKVLSEVIMKTLLRRAGLHYLVICTWCQVTGCSAHQSLNTDNPLNIYTHKQNTSPHNLHWLSFFWNFLNKSGACYQSCHETNRWHFPGWKQKAWYLQETSDFELSSEADVVIGQCGLTNKCAHISCEHGGTCRHVSTEPNVYCDCDNTGGYTGATCRTSNTWRSCGQYLDFTGERSVSNNQDWLKRFIL